jgi:hypothetical protein
MNHWETVGRMAAEHRADLDREADRASLAALVRAAHPSVRRTWRPVVTGWLHGLQTRPGSLGRRSGASRSPSKGG